TRLTGQLAWAMAILIQLAISPLARWALPPVILTARTSRRRFPLIHLATQDSEGRSSKSCAGSMAPITSHSLSFRTSSMDKLVITMGIFDLIGPAAFRLCHRLKKKTARAGFISAFIGPSIRPKASPRVVGSAITYSITLSGRRIRAEAVSCTRRKYLVWLFECVGQ